jgi:hypothetical protein
MINIVIGIWSSNSSVYISKWLCHNVFILYIFRFAKNKWNFVLIHDLIIPSLVTDRFLSGFDWFSIGFDLIELTKLMVCFQLNSFCIYSEQEVFMLNLEYDHVWI